MRAYRRQTGARARGFTLIELLLTIAIILLLISMLLPALNRGHSKIKSLQCRSNLHQTGLAMLYFANSHEDMFPVQVSTNLGGSQEFLAAGQAVQGEFYFSFRHFLPLAPELHDPKLLVCPADLRSPATNFAELRNTNLSYFAAANPVYMSSDSIVSGDRNLTPVSNSIARLSLYQPLRWTAEMHKNRGNVLFGDAHVEQLNEVLSLGRSPGTPPVSLVMPSARMPAATLGGTSGAGTVQWGGGGGVSPFGGSLSVSTPATNAFVFTNAVITNLVISSGPRHTPPWLYLKGGPGEGPALPVLDFPDEPSSPITVNTSAPLVIEAVPPPHTEVAQSSQAPVSEPGMFAAGKSFAERGLAVVGTVPWWLLALLVLLAFWLLKRTRDRRPVEPEQKERPWVVPGRN